MSTLQQAIANLQTIIGAIPGIRQAPDTAPEKITQFPFAVAYPESGSIDLRSGGWYKGLHTIVLELHVARKDLPRDIATAMPFIESIPAALDANPTLNGSVDTIVSPVNYQFQELGWEGDVITLGFRFNIQVKINTVNQDDD